MSIRFLVSAVCAVTLGGHAQAECNPDKPPFSFWHKAGIERVSGQEQLSIRLENASRSPVTLQPLVFVNGVLHPASPAPRPIECGGVAFFTVPVRFAGTGSVIHVVYQRDPALGTASAERLRQGALNQGVLEEAVRGTDQDVLFDAGDARKRALPPAHAASTERPLPFAGMYFQGATPRAVRTGLRAERSAVTVPLVVGTQPGLPATTQYVTCLVNGKQHAAFQGRLLATYRTKPGQSVAIPATFTALKTGVNHVKCYVLNGLGREAPAGTALLTPNNVSALYILRAGR